MAQTNAVYLHDVAADWAAFIQCQQSASAQVSTATMSQLPSRNLGIVRAQQSRIALLQFSA
jgi:hypothetical protein